jgi:hypothetical protein
MRSLGAKRRLGRDAAQLRILRSLGHDVPQLLLRIYGTIAVVQELDRELGERAAIAAELASFLQRGLPLLSLDAILLVGTILANARDLNEPSHQNSVAEVTSGRDPLGTAFFPRAVARDLSRAPHARSRKQHRPKNAGNTEPMRVSAKTASVVQASHIIWKIACMLTRALGYWPSPGHQAEASLPASGPAAHWQFRDCVGSAPQCTRRSTKAAET